MKNGMKQFYLPFGLDRGYCLLSADYVWDFSYVFWDKSDRSVFCAWNFSEG